ncbi:MAG: gamma-carboxygeranoyl-CoA hydratase [Legionella sp.]|nr:MAG: gamma-carboxygeranoyl-CoA hydratase [Legionella sp.]
MSDLLYEIQDHLCLITLNRESKLNAFDDQLLIEMQKQFEQANNNTQVRVIILKANGKHFSAGADLAWMQRMAQFSKAENLKDALILSRLMHTIHHSPKPTIAMVQGSTFGGGAGLVAACDIGIAADNARFCFSEVRLGLIPAVISPYVVKAIGERTAKALFMSAELFDAQRALAYNLVHHCQPEDQLLNFTLKYAEQISQCAPESVRAAKKLTEYVAHKNIDEELGFYTANLIAQKRVSSEGQKGLQAFLNKETPNWN